MKEPKRPKKEDYQDNDIELGYYVKAMEHYYKERRKWLKSLKTDEQWETYKEAKKEKRDYRKMTDSDFKRLQKDKLPQSKIMAFLKKGEKKQK